MNRPYLLILGALVLTLVVSSGAHAQEGGDRNKVGVQKLNIELREYTKSGVTGTAVLRRGMNGKTVVDVRLSNNPGDEGQPAHLHEGTCQGTIPSIRYPLENVVKDRSRTVIDKSIDELLTEDLFINIHQSAEDLDNIIVCGQVRLAGLPATGAGGASPSRSQDVAAALALAGVALAGCAVASRRRAARQS